MTDDAPSDHIVLCGFGAVGRVAARELQDADAAYVLIASPAEAQAASILGLRFVCGDPADRDALMAAGVDRARALVACTGSHAADLATARAARDLRPDIAIVAFHGADGREHQLTRAGATTVVSADRAAGRELALRALHPVAGEREEYCVSEVTVAADASGAGHAIAALRGGAFVIGLRRANGSFVPLPPAETLVRPGDAVMTLGTPHATARLERLLGTHRPQEEAPATGLPRTTRRM